MTRDTLWLLLSYAWLIIVASVLIYTLLVG